MAVAIPALIALGAALIVGLVGYRRHSGYFAPVWDEDAKHVFVVKRESALLFWGTGWEFVTPPAKVLVTRDRFELLRLDTETGQSDRLQYWDDSPLVGETFHAYRGRMLGSFDARLEPVDHGVQVLFGIGVPHHPSSREWSLRAHWTEAGAEEGRWKPEPAGDTAASDAVLRNGRELIVLPGEGEFPVAVLSVDEDGAYRVIARSTAFEDAYRDGVPAKLIAERSRREGIERLREFVRVQDELRAGFRAQGLGEAEAVLRAYDEMETLGHLPKSPRLVATPIDAPADSTEVFEIPDGHLQVGLFQDIAAAVARPGTEVKTDTGDYLQYDNDTLGPRLRAYREAGNDRFVIKLEERFYLMETKRFGDGQGRAAER